MMRPETRDTLATLAVVATVAVVAFSGGWLCGFLAGYDARAHRRPPADATPVLQSPPSWRAPPAIAVLLEPRA